MPDSKYSEKQKEIFAWFGAEFAKGPTDSEKWEAFYLLSPPPICVNDPDEYNRIRRRLLAEGKRCYWEHGDARL